METARDKRKRTLHHIVQELLERLWQIDDAEGEVSDDLAGELDELEVEYCDKIDRILSVVDNYRAKQDVLSRRAKALQNHSKRIKKEADWLERYALDSMRATGVNKLECKDHPVVAVRVNPPAVHIFDETVLAGHDEGRFIVERVERRPDKTAIKKAIDTGDRVPGAELRRSYKLVY